MRKLSLALASAALAVATWNGPGVMGRLVGGAGGLALAADGFVQGIDDLPLMPGLSGAAEESLVFLKPSGRIVHAVARGAVTAPAVARFYAESMPQLGWRAHGTNHWVREGEQLQLEIVPGGQGAAPLTTVRFDLNPE